MKTVRKSRLSETEKNLLWNLWNEVYPVTIRHDSVADLESYLNALIDIEHYLMYDDSGQLIAWAFTFLREEENWFAILLFPQAQKQGYGTKLLKELQKNANTLNGWVIEHNNYLKQNGENYLSPMPFYLKNNFVICNDIRINTDKISAVKIEWTNIN